jgi:hypothetical protein
VRRFNLLLMVCFACVTGSTLLAAPAKVIKVLPHFLDLKGRASLVPSLYERDAYQAFLLKHSEQRSALRFDVQWKARSVDWSKLKLRVEMRGVTGNVIHSQTLEQAARQKGWFSNWSALTLSGEEFRKLGELVSCRATLWEGDQQLAEQKSFLW